MAADAYEFVGRNDLTESGKVAGDLTFNDGYWTVKNRLVRLLFRGLDEFVDLQFQKNGVPRRTHRMIMEEVTKSVQPFEEVTVTGIELEITDFTDVKFRQDRRLHGVTHVTFFKNLYPDAR
jgi:anaphase-promoting complex subunit 1